MKEIVEYGLEKNVDYLNIRYYFLNYWFNFLKVSLRDDMIKNLNNIYMVDDLYKLICVNVIGKFFTLRS